MGCGCSRSGKRHDGEPRPGAWRPSTIVLRRQVRIKPWEGASLSSASSEAEEAYKAVLWEKEHIEQISKEAAEAEAEVSKEESRAFLHLQWLFTDKTPSPPPPPPPPLPTPPLPPIHKDYTPPDNVSPYLACQQLCC
eukprot:TRINITY_DN38120_c0_g1_i1.p1 TRINITY_DN38120_c0_g1~~TRINITY_DN38120_c0_g1_i1.p1  ORF type:complete len:148 (+),score=32.36 TRINITY_DN38120_c0_g1_i1:36-446(+)